MNKLKKEVENKYKKHAQTEDSSDDILRSQWEHRARKKHEG